MTSQPWLVHYDPGVPFHIEYPDVPVFFFLDQAARLCPDRACIIFQGEELTYREVATLTDRLSMTLLDLGIRPGDRVGIFMPNCPEFVLAFLAILKVGAVVVAINPLYTPAEIVHQVNDAGLMTVFCSERLFPVLQAASVQTGIRSVIVTGDQGSQQGALSFTELLARPLSSSTLLDPPAPVSVGPDDLALFQYTGGTTGVAKAVVVSHRNLVANTLQFKAWMSTLKEEQETFLLAIPVYHIYGMVCGMLLGLSLRATLVIIPNPRAIPDLLSAVQSHQVTYFPAVPTLYNAINNSPEVISGKVDLTSIKACISGSAPLMRQTKERFENLTGGAIVEGFGLSEAPTATHCNPLQGENRFGSIGLPLPDVDAKIVSLDDGLTDMAVGEPGELLIRGPQVMQGYYRMPQETLSSLRGGWLYTGDIARMDAEGYFYIVDRKKDLIKPGGMEVWPREVEEVIISHTSVAEVAVAGIPDEYRGETIKAWVVLIPGESLSMSDVQNWCRERLAAFKVPTQVEFRDHLPRSSVGKVLKKELTGR